MICSVCKQPIQGSSYHDHWGNLICWKHHGILPTCFSCGRIVCESLTHGGMLYQDGRMMCNLCRSTAIVTPEDAKPVVKKVLKIFSLIHFKLDQDKIPIRLMGRSEMKSISTRSYAESPVGLACLDHEKHNGQWQRSVKEIIIQYGLPAEHFAEILAHELGHAWMWLQNYPQDIPEQVEEGVCQLFSYIWLRQQRTPEAAFRMKQIESFQDKIYGEGYRLADIQFKKRNLLGMLEYIKCNRRFPN